MLFFVLLISTQADFSRIWNSSGTFAHIEKWVFLLNSGIKTLINVDLSDIGIPK